MQCQQLVLVALAVCVFAAEKQDQEAAEQYFLRYGSVRIFLFIFIHLFLDCDAYNVLFYRLFSIHPGTTPTLTPLATPTPLPTLVPTLVLMLPPMPTLATRYVFKSIRYVE